ncbi:protein-disulfide reductase DsbD domain-containing protein [Roseibium sp.]|uniref:protein-disulfide reductase DsbD domain-containing protein n=1 Tax=Roseibium sp. TaxID=1936156 RepID=UPI003D12C6D4
MKRVALFLSLALIAISSPARAATTDWVEVQGGAVRLVATGPLESGKYLAGLEFLLEPGWHTYWRYPGEAGIPPQISFPGSVNLGQTEILYPVPQRYDDGFTKSIVYYDGIILPMKVTPEAPEKGVLLSLDVFFGICKEICIPADASLSLPLEPQGETDELAARLIARDLAMVPTSGETGGLSIGTVTLSGNGGSLVIETEAPENTTPDLFAAAPGPSYIGLPELDRNDGGRAVWRLPLKGLAVAEDDDQLRLVLAANGKAVVHLVTIDPSWLK